MERHQSSIHERRYSWSCWNILDYQAAFHPSNLDTVQTPTTDACGYCGKEFPNLPSSENVQMEHLKVRMEHLNNDHKYSQCSQTKKFFRADHFRQHLEHRHAGVRGAWMSSLEKACRIEEPLPEALVDTLNDLAGKTKLDERA